MKQTFDTYLRRHPNGWYTLRALVHPEYAAFGPDVVALREELRAALASELTAGELQPGDDLHHDDWEQSELELELNLVQYDRLIQVPVRFLLVMRKHEKGAWTVRVPRLGMRFTIRGRHNVLPWASERIRGHFHLKPVDAILAHRFGRREKVEALPVVYHGAKQQKEAARKQRIEKALSRKRSALDEVGVELTAQAREGSLPHCLGREKELQQLLGILGGATPNSVMLVGPPGVGKTALVQELAHRVLADRVPPRLRGVRVWHMSAARVMAGMKYLGQWQQRAYEVVNRVRSGRAILFVDSALEVVSAGSSDPAQGLGQLLLPFISSGEITVVCEATPDALRLAERKHASFIQSFRQLPLSAMGLERSFRVLEELSHRVGRRHKSSFEAPAINAALDVLARFGEARSLPGAGIRLLEDMARLNPRTELNPQHAIAAFSRSSGFPEEIIDPERVLDVDEVRAFFEQRVVGQRPATELLTSLVMVAKASLNDPSKPLGSFLFMGPTGVGKTEAALTLAEYLFGDRERLLRFDMSEYGVPGSAMRLVGGMGGEGDLTRRVRAQPFCVLLFDELEKAEPGVFDVLLQVLGEGRLTDATGRTVSFRHCIVIMTSNLGARGERSIGLTRPDAQDLNAHFERAARDFFRPEFVNRVDSLVPFRALDRGDVRTIARGMLERALAREGLERRRVTVSFDEQVLELLLQRGFDARYGARPMKRAIEQHVMVPLSRRLALRQGAATLQLYVREGQVAVLSGGGPEGGPAAPFSTVALDNSAVMQRYMAELRRRWRQWQDAPVLRELRERGQGWAEVAVQSLLEQVSVFEDGDGAREARIAQALALDAQALALEGRLLQAQLGERSQTVTVVVEGESALRAQLAGQLMAWTQAWGLQVTPLEQGWRVQGPAARTLLMLEAGRHRVRRGDEVLELSVQLLDEAPVGGLVRESLHGPDGPTWDVRTGQEAPVGLERLAEQLTRFVVARAALVGDEG